MELNMTVEEFNELKEVPSAIELHIKEEINNQWNDERCILEDEFYLNIEGIGYAFVLFDEDNWEDDGSGKYQYCDEVYELVCFDLSERKYPCGKNILSRFNLFASVSSSRTGSYYTDYYYNYDKPTYYKAEVKHVNEVIIPAHDKVVLNKS